MRILTSALLAAVLVPVAALSQEKSSTAPAAPLPAEQQIAAAVLPAPNDMRPVRQCWATLPTAVSPPSGTAQVP